MAHNNATTGAAETKAIHDVMELVRGIPVLSEVAFRLREHGLLWRDGRAGRGQCPDGLKSLGLANGHQ